MEWNVILNTREWSSDYRFYLHPEYIVTLPQLGSEKEPLIRRFIRQMERVLLNADEEVDLSKLWHDTVVFVYDDEAYYLLRYAKTYEKDDRGRSIFTTEGLVCPRKDEKKMLLDLPNAIVYLLSNNGFVRDKYFAHEVMHTVDVPEKINWLEDNEMCSEVTEALEEKLVEQIEELNVLLNTERKVFAFVIGSLAGQISKYVERIVPDMLVRDMSSLEVNCSKSSVYRMTKCDFEQKDKKIPIALFNSLVIEEKGTLKNQCAVLDETNNIIVKTKVYESSMLALAEIERQRYLMELYLKYRGYVNIL